MEEFTHFNQSGRARMVDVGHKLNTQREAVVSGSIYMKPETLQQITDQTIKKGDVLAVAQVAGIMAAKRTGDLIPMCHNVFISGADVEFEIDRDCHRIGIEATVRTTGKTGVEMEAFVAASVAAMTIYDMCKAVDREMRITDLSLMRKAGGKSGDYQRQESADCEK